VKILIITSCFAPKNVIGAVRVSKIAKYLIREGYDLTIISPVLEEYDLRDITLECNEFKETRRITVPYAHLTTKLTKSYKKDNHQKKTGEIRNQVNTSVKANIYRLLRNGFACWRDYEWGRKVQFIIQKDAQKYDIVFSSYPNLAAHNSALFAKKIGKAKKWIADFRDPLALDTIKGRRKKDLSKIQSEIVKNADLTLHVSKAGTEKFICYPDDRKKVVWVPNGFDEEDFGLMNITSEFMNREEIVFSYAGGLYGGERDCSPLFKAVRELIDDGKISIEDVKLEYAGSDFSILTKQAEKFNVAEIICNKGIISRTEAIELQSASDCVVVATFCYKDNEGAMTGKIYEPIMMRRPVLLLVNGPGKNSEPGKFVNYLKAGIVYEDSYERGDVTKIKKHILKLRKEKKNYGGISSEIDESRRDEFDYKSITRKLIANINRLEMSK